MHVITSSIPYTIPINTPNTIQTPSSLVDSSLVSYAMLLISNGFKSCMVFTGWVYMKLFIIGLILHGLKSFIYFIDWLSMTLVIFWLILHMFWFFLNIYGSYLNSIHHSYFYTHQFSPVAHTFPSLALYPHGAIESFVFSIQYANISDIS